MVLFVFPILQQKVGGLSPSPESGGPIPLSPPPAPTHMIMRHLGYDEKIIRIPESLYKVTMTAVRVDGGLTDWFTTVAGVLQGCVLSPLLFNILLKVVMMLMMDGNQVDV